MPKRRLLLPIVGAAILLLGLGALTPSLARATAAGQPRLTNGASIQLPPIPGPASGWPSEDSRPATRGQSGWSGPAFALSPEAAASQAPGQQEGPFTLFQPAVTITLAAQAQAVGMGDFNDDGRTDVALTTGWPENLLYVFTQTVTGRLAAPVTLTTGAHPQALAVGDINQDGRADLVVANYLSDTLAVYVQAPTGGLTSSLSFPTAEGPNAVSLVDLNDDGRDDAVVSHDGSGVLGVLEGRLDGSFDPMISYPSPLAGWDDLAIGDLNGDGLSDVVKSNGQFPANPTLSIYLQDPAGGLSPTQQVDLGDLVASGLAAGDLNNDGLDDLAVSAGGNRPFATLTVISQTLTGTLGATRTLAAYDLPETLAIQDLNADGRKDLLALHGGWSGLSVYLQNALGRLAPYQLYDLPTPGALHYGPGALAVGDINGDGLPDAAIADAINGLVLLYHQPPQELTFMPIVQAPVPLTDTPLFDDFSDPESGWPRIQSIYADFDYLDGEYQILNKDQFVAAFVTAGHRLADLDAAVTGRRVGGAVGAYGLAFGFADTVPVSEYFALIVWPEFQEWDLIRFSAEAGFEALYWGVASNLQTGGGSNRLRVRRQGEGVELWLNGVPVFGTNHPTYSGSRLIGLLQSPLELFHDARFDDYELNVP